jgi:hypothetical protein
MRGTRGDRIFSRGIEKLMLPPGPCWSTHIEYCSPWVTKTEVLTKSTHSPSPERWVSNRVHQACLEAPTISKSSPRTPKSPRPSRSYQTPRVTSPHTFTWPEHSAKPCMHLEHLITKKNTTIKRKRIPNGNNTLFFSPWLQWIFRMTKAALERQGAYL